MTQFIDEYIQLITDTLSYVTSQMEEDSLKLKKPEHPSSLENSKPKFFIKTPSLKKKIHAKTKEELPQEKTTNPAPAQKGKWTMRETLGQSEDSMQDLRLLLSKIAPQYPITPTVLDDSLGRRKASEWKYKMKATPVTIFVFQDKPQERKLLENIGKAIEIYFTSARLISAEEIEKQQRWDAFFSSDKLKLIIACQKKVYQLKSLMTFYKEIPSSSETFLNDLPFFMLPDLSLYLKNPILKRSLWKAICAKLTKLLPSS